jgi:hypothetical protein
MTTNLNQYEIAKSDPNSNNYAYYQKDLYNFPFTSQFRYPQDLTLGKTYPAFPTIGQPGITTEIVDSWYAWWTNFASTDSPFGQILIDFLQMSSNISQFDLEQDYSLLDFTQLTADQLETDATLNDILRRNFEQYIGQDWQGNCNINNQPKLNLDYSTNTLLLKWKIFVAGLLHSMNIYSVPFFLWSWDNMLNFDVGLAVRPRRFDYNVNNYFTLTMVDTVTGEEKYRIINGISYDANNNEIIGENQAIAYVRRVNNNIPDVQLSNLSLYEQLNIATCLPTTTINYAPVDQLIATIQQDIQLNINPTGGVTGAGDTFYDAIASDPYIDNVNGLNVMGGVRLLALDNIYSNKNYILSSIFGEFLPFNEFKYNIYDMNTQQSLPHNMYNTQNLTTILKIFGITLGTILLSKKIHIKLPKIVLK